jgi:hypothetical protein
MVIVGQIVAVGYFLWVALEIVPLILGPIGRLIYFIVGLGLGAILASNSAETAPLESLERWAMAAICFGAVALAVGLFVTTAIRVAASGDHRARVVGILGSTTALAGLMTAVSGLVN